MTLLLLTACGAGPDPATAPPSLPVCAPWAEWAPVEAGRVIHCDERRLHVSYPAGSADALAPTWRLAVEGQGFLPGMDTSAPGAVAVRYSKGSPPADGDEPGELTLALTLLDAPTSTELAATVTRP